MDPAQAVRAWRLLGTGLAAFGVAVFFLVVQAWAEDTPGIPPTAALGPRLPALSGPILGGHRAGEIVRKVDYDVLLFFTWLFVVVGLEKTGTMEALGGLMSDAFRGQSLALLSPMMGCSAVPSGMAGGAPPARTMASVVTDLVGQAGVPALSMMAWSVSLGTDMGGNGTPHRRLRDVVAYASMDEHGQRMGWGRRMGVAIPPPLVPCAFATWDWRRCCGSPSPSIS